VRGAGARRSLQLGFVAGLAFWLPGIWWISYVTYLGWAVLSAYCALYFAAFAWVVNSWLRRWGGGRWRKNLSLMFAATAAWVCVEYVRSVFCTGFPWNTLAISQYEIATVRQLAEWGGVYAVSAVLVFFNLALVTTIFRYRESKIRLGRSAHPELCMGLLVMAMAVAAGMRSILSRDGTLTTPAHIGVVQTDIPQMDKWTADTHSMIYDRLESQTLALGELEHLDLIVWPETALPDEVLSSDVSYAMVQELVAEQVPILVGTMDSYQRDTDERIFYFNSSMLFHTSGRITYRYDKQHLVMWGEYVPFEEALPFLWALTPNEASFTAGKKAVVFELASPAIEFSTLICFEDTLPYLSRRAVLEGARLLINQTNDAWFERSSASRQHMTHCVFRCIENRVPAVRCANTGVSCFIDANGNVQRELTDEAGSTFSQGVMSFWTFVPKADHSLTFYTRHGDVFAWICSGITLGTLMVFRLRIPIQIRGDLTKSTTECR
jgi:apolipoprotein N-acyltransferase